ncbi:MAG: helix-turn-helix domain-containing protein [Bacteroidota bacterium]
MESIKFEIPILDEIKRRLEKIESRLDSIHQNNKFDKSGGWLSTKEASTALGVTPRCLQNYRDQGKIPFSQFGREVRYRAEDIQQFLLDHYVKPADWKGGER